MNKVDLRKIRKRKVKVYSSGEVAKMLGLSIKTIQKWIKEGRIKAYKTLGGRYKIPEEEVKRLIELYYFSENKNKKKKGGGR